MTGIKEGAAVRPVPKPKKKPRRGSIGRIIALAVIAVVGLSIGLGGAYLLLVGNSRKSTRQQRLSGSAADAVGGIDVAAARTAEPDAAVARASSKPDLQQPTDLRAASAADAAGQKQPTPDRVTTADTRKPAKKQTKKPTKKQRPRKRHVTKKPRKGTAVVEPRTTTKPGSRIKTVVVKPESKSGQGQIIIRSEPWANIYVDGRNIKKTTSGRPILIPAGKHTIKLINPAMKLQKSFTVDVAPGGKIRRFINLSE